VSDSNRGGPFDVERTPTHGTLSAHARAPSSVVKKNISREHTWKKCVGLPLVAINGMEQWPRLLSLKGEKRNLWGF